MPDCPKCNEPMRELACVECHVCDACSPSWDGIGSCHEKRPAVGFAYECAPRDAMQVDGGMWEADN